MKKSFKEQLEDVRPEVIARRDVEERLRELFNEGVSTNTETAKSVDLGDKSPEYREFYKKYEEAFSKALETRESKEKSETKKNDSDRTLNYTICAAFSAIAACCLYVIGRTYNNTDKSPKFRL